MDNKLSDLKNVYKKIEEFEIINYKIEPNLTISASIFKKQDEDYYKLKVSHRITLPGSDSFYNKDYSATSLEKIYDDLRYYLVLAADTKKAERID